jgi:alginate O-acetyltransferase complex protein AlgI
VTFDLTTVGLLVALALGYGVLPGRWRPWALLAGSVIAVYWLQPFLLVRHMDFILPTLTIMLALVGWFITRKPDDDVQHATLPQDRVTLAVVVGLVVLLAGFRYIDADYRWLVASRPPNPLWVLGVIAVVLVSLLLARRPIYGRQGAALVTLAALIVGLFVLLKIGPLALWAAELGRSLTGRDPSLANPATDLSWLGFSYVAFRLLHTLRDRQTGLLPALSLRDYLTYVIFFPAYIAGPIDRAERFQGDLAALPDQRGYDAGRWTEGLGRIAVGALKKFVIADTLALGLALNPTNAAQAESTLWLWVLLYGYALQLFFDFSGYTDIAIGIGVLFGVKLPENFKRPYFKTDITSFWQSWHVTLSDWARFYVFSPLSRSLLRRKPKPSPTLIVLSAQVATMVTIGLWHGVTWNFLLWGLWHGVGLFVHKQWTDRTRKWYRQLKDRTVSFRAWKTLAWALTFHYVVLGWVWFALPTLAESLAVFGRLFGVR